MIDLVDERRGHLVITKGPVDKHGTQLYWEAVCDCGNRIVVDGHSFKRGAVTSCGCIRLSSGETLISSLLDDAKIPYLREFTFSDLLGDTGHRLRYDFALLDSDGKVTRLIEFDGEQHYKAVDKFGGEALLQKLRRYDRTKNMYAIEHNIPLVRIPYNKLAAVDVNSLLGEEFLIA